MTVDQEKIQDKADDDVFMAVEALGKLKNSVSESPSPPMTTQNETFLDRVTSHPLISNSIKIIEKNIQDNKRRWFQEEPQKLQNLKELGIANFNIESRRKLQMLINFLKLGNNQLNTRIEYLSEICEQERIKKGLLTKPAPALSATESQEHDNEKEAEEDEEADEYHDAQSPTKTVTESTATSSRSASPPPIESKQEIKSEIVGTVKKIVKVVSKFTGSSLPEPARTHVREILLKLPNNWATHKDSISSSDQLDPNGKVLLLAQESLEMIKKILSLCTENLDSLESWNHLKVEEQKFLKEKILIKNHHYVTANEQQQQTVIQEEEEEEEEEVEGEEEDAERQTKRIKIGINDLVNSEESAKTPST